MTLAGALFDVAALSIVVGSLARGKNLACWCALGDVSCHADVLLEIANAAAGGTHAP